MPRSFPQFLMNTLIMRLPGWDSALLGCLFVTIEIHSCLRTLRLKEKAEGCAWLNAAAIEVNQVWNYATHRSHCVRAERATSTGKQAAYRTSSFGKVILLVRHAITAGGAFEKSRNGNPCWAIRAWPKRACIARLSELECRRRSNVSNPAHLLPCKCIHPSRAGDNASAFQPPIACSAGEAP